MSQDFIPVALKAAQINNPPPGVEGDLYAEISRSKPAPQGICVANSDGKVLSWVLSFDDDSSVKTFLDHALSQFKLSPDASHPVAAQRYRKFPSQKLPDMADSGRKPAIPDQHSARDRCPAEPRLERGTLVGRIVGRPLDKNGQPIEKTLRQEDYMEARFDVPPSVQRRFARLVAGAKDEESFAVPPELARLLVSHAYLGQLDVNPLGGPQTGGQTDHEEIALQARRVGGSQSHPTVYVTGTSDVSGSPAGRADGRRWEHRVQLAWEGYLDIDGDRITGLALTARGKERLRWGNAQLLRAAEPDVAHLMAGHPIDLDAEVRYGLTAQPIAEEAADEAGTGRPEAAIPPQERLNHLREAVKHLRAAGVGDLADQLERQAERMREALESGRKPRK